MPELAESSSSGSDSSSSDEEHGVIALSRDGGTAEQQLMHKRIAEVAASFQMSALPDVPVSEQEAAKVGLKRAREDHRDLGRKMWSGFQLESPSMCTIMMGVKACGGHWGQLRAIHFVYMTSAGFL